MTTRALLLVLLPLLTTAGCDTSPDALEEDDLEMRWVAALEPMPNPGVGFEPYHGRWEGPMTQVDGITQNEYDAAIMLAPGFCTISGSDIHRAQWDYHQLGIVCHSDLELLGMSLAPDGTRTWNFYDHSLSPNCIDGLVTLTETDDPAVMHHTWSDTNGVLDATGLVTYQGVCGSGGET